jgi:low affinity Fe/Cu permease
MISDAELAELPDDPEQAFIGYERKLREKTIDALEHSDGGSAQTIQLQYINLVIAAARFFGMEFLQNFEVPRVSASNIHDSYVQLISDVDHCTLQLRLRHTRRAKQYSVALDAPTKAKIRHHLAQVREIVDKLDVEPPKKDALYSKISSLEAEVNRERTRLEAFADLVLETAGVAGEAARKLEPVRKLIDSISRAIKQAKDAEETLAPSLPKSEGRPKIEPPRKRLEPPTAPDTGAGGYGGSSYGGSRSGGDLDDDIPF